MAVQSTIDMSGCECCGNICCAEDALEITVTISNGSGTPCDQITLSGSAVGLMSIVTFDHWVAPAGATTGPLTFSVDLVCDVETNSYVANIAAEAGDCGGSILHTLENPDVVQCDPFRVEFHDRNITFTGTPNCCGTALTVNLTVVFTL